MMRSVFGLLLALASGGLAIYLKIEHGFGDVAFGLVLAFGIVVGVVVAFSDRLTSLKFAGSEIALAKAEIDSTAKRAIAEIEARLDRLPKDYYDLMQGENGTFYMGAGCFFKDETGRRYVKAHGKIVYEKKKG